MSHESNQLKTLKKKADFYEVQNKVLLKKLNESQKLKPIENCTCIPHSIIVNEIEEIKKLTFLDSFDLEKEIAFSDDDKITIYITREPKIKEFKA